MPEVDSDIQIEDAFFDKYPADVARLVAITPSVGTEQVDHKQLEKLAKDYSVQYQQLQALLKNISDCLSDFLQNGNETKNASGKKDQNKKQGKQEVEAVNLEAVGIEGTSAAATDEIVSTDSLAIAVTAQFLQEVQQAYQNSNFYEMWTMLTDFCENDLRFYVQTVKSRPAETLHAAQTTLSQIGTTLLQRLAPLVPFLAEHFYPLISTEGVVGKHSIFQKNWHLLSPVDEQTLHISDIETDDAKAEWEVLKNTYDANS